jgi:hypothetical protein
LRGEAFVSAQTTADPTGYDAPEVSALNISLELCTPLFLSPHRTIPGLAAFERASESPPPTSSNSVYMIFTSIAIRRYVTITGDAISAINYEREKSKYLKRSLGARM